MEDVEGLMRGLKLSAAEKRGMKIGEAEKGKSYDWAPDDPQAVGKLFSEKPVHAGVIGQTLGRIWCPIKGLECKELEANVFLFTFRQATGWRRALEEGPWWFDKELLVMEEFDPEKTVDEYEFNLIPMWIRVFGLPLRYMNRATGERIGAGFHEFIDVDVGHDGKAVGKYLRVKVKLDIKEPLMRGFVLDREKKKEGSTAEEMGGLEDSNKKKKKDLLWCRFEYEHMPDFCYTCGVIGHGEKDCNRKPARGEAPQYGPWMRAEEGSRRGDEAGKGRWSDGRGNSDNRNLVGGRGSQGDRRQYNWGKVSGGSGSDGPSWKKEGAASRSSNKSNGDEEKEVTSPLKITGKEDITMNSKVAKTLQFEKAPAARKEDDHSNTGMVVDGADEDRNRAGLNTEKGKSDVLVSTNMEKEDEKDGKKGTGAGVGVGTKGGKKYRRKERVEGGALRENLGVKLGKRDGDDMDVDGANSNNKKSRTEGQAEHAGKEGNDASEEVDRNTNILAGLSE